MTTDVDRAVLPLVEQYRMDRVERLMDPHLVYVDEVNHPLIEMVRMDLAVDLIRRMPEARAVMQPAALCLEWTRWHVSLWNRAGLLRSC